jgi:hypothetical protein
VPELVTLENDCNLGPAGLQVWVNDAAEAEKPKRGRPAKKVTAKAHGEDDSPAGD